MQRITQSLLILLLSLFSCLAMAQDNGLLDIQHEWEHIYYQIPEDQQDAAFPHLEGMTDALIKEYPGRAEPLIWKAIVLSTHADA